jgi:hypothetical protein
MLSFDRVSAIPNLSHPFLTALRRLLFNVAVDIGLYHNGPFIYGFPKVRFLPFWLEAVTS